MNCMDGLMSDGVCSSLIKRTHPTCASLATALLAYLLRDDCVRLDGGEDGDGGSETIGIGGGFGSGERERFTLPTRQLVFSSLSAI
jgi:hypothetical protein